VTQSLLFTDLGQDELLVTNGTTVAALSTITSTPAFGVDPIYGDLSAMVVGSTTYLTMPDTTGGTSAIWSYNGTVLTQITPSSDYVYNQPDFNNATAPYPLTSFNADLVFSQATLASNTAGDGNFDKAALAVYNPSTGATATPTVPDGGYDPGDFVTLNGELYFEAIDSPTNALAIYSYNGTSVTEIYNLHPTSTIKVGFTETIDDAGYVNGPSIAFNGSLYFASGQESVEELTSTSSLQCPSGDSASHLSWLPVAAKCA
jgi:hypothetical protein